MQLFADDLRGFALDHSPPGELGAHTIHFPEEGGVGAESSLIVDALLEDITAETFERLFRNTAGDRSLWCSESLFFRHCTDTERVLCRAPPVTTPSGLYLLSHPWDPFLRSQQAHAVHCMSPSPVNDDPRSRVGMGSGPEGNDRAHGQTEA